MTYKGIRILTASKPSIFQKRLHDDSNLLELGQPGQVSRWCGLTEHTMEFDGLVLSKG
jgi:hypothetical protein